MTGKPVAYIIGSGVAGLACAVRLAVQGLQVHVFEKNNVPGGKLGWLQMNGFCFDTGPSLFVQPENLHSLFEYAGEDINAYFNYRKVEDSCKYFFADGTILETSANKKMLLKEVLANTKEPAKNINKYLDEVHATYTSTADIFLNQPIHKVSTFINKKIFKALAAVKLSDLFSTLHTTNTKAFSDKNVIQLFDRFATYNGSNPYRSPGMFRVIAEPELNEGVYYPEGGMISIIHALHQLAEKKGVTFHFNQSVEKIICRNGIAKGIIVNGEELFANVIISNVDVYNTYRYLLNDEHYAGKLMKQERSTSAIVFYWGINKSFEQLQLHNIFFSADYEAEFDHIFQQKKLYHDPTVYVNITSKQQPSHAPDGKENWFVMVNVAADTDYDSDTLTATCRQAVVAKLSNILGVDVASYIEEEQVMHPKIIEQNTNAYLGALYGAASNSRSTAFKRHANFSNSVKRLYFVGGTVHPGGGIPLCLKSAGIAANLIAADKIKWSNHHET